jgi:hypothetical protein
MTPEANRLAEFEPSTAFVTLRPAGLRLRDPRTWVPGRVEVDTEKTLYGWTVAEVFGPPPQNPEEQTPESGAGLLDQLGVARQASESDGALVDWENNPDAHVERVIVTPGTRNALIKLSGPRSAFDVSGKVTRIPLRSDRSGGERSKKNDGDKSGEGRGKKRGNDKDMLDSFIDRNGFADGVDYTVLRPDRIASGEVSFSNPVAMGQLVCSRLLDIITTAQPKTAEAPRTYDPIEPDQ